MTPSERRARLYPEDTDRRKPTWYEAAMVRALRRRAEPTP